MPMDFPSSPTVGQQYNGYVWDGTAWDSTSAQPISLSTTAPGYNAIINGGFDIWQRGTSFAFNGSNNTGYTADRWWLWSSGTTSICTVSRQAFTPGAAPVAGYESEYFLRFATTTITSSNIHSLWQKIEDVRTFAGQAVTLSFWAKADAARTLNVRGDQLFGTGGSTEVAFSAGSASLTTSWQRFNLTFNFPSISGKTIGAGSSTNILFDMPMVNGSSVDLWGVQLEAGSAATAFRRNAPSIQAELAACQRYFHTNLSTEAIARTGGYSNAYFSSTAFPVTMRSNPTITFYTDANFGGTVGNIKAYWASVGNNVAPTIWSTSNININMYVGYASTEFAQFSYKADAEL